MGLDVFGQKMMNNYSLSYSAPDGKVLIPKKTIENMTNTEKGYVGEISISNALTNLGIYHEHHNFTTLEAYEEDNEKGADLWSNQFEIESKLFPLSILTGQSHYDKLVKPRFSHKVRIKGLVVQYCSNISDDFVLVANKDGTYVVNVENPKYLKTKLKYFLEKYNVLPRIKYSYTISYSAYIEYSCNSTDSYSSDSILSGIWSISGLGPPFEDKILPTLFKLPSASTFYKLIYEGGKK